MTTIRRLREYLHELEMNWSALDEDYLGKFEDQTINVPHYPEGTARSTPFTTQKLPIFNTSTTSSRRLPNAPYPHNSR
jgi:hypothetical protein